MKKVNNKNNCTRSTRIGSLLFGNAFTLAEVMIVLIVIGTLAAVMLPAAQRSMPNDNIMKFKKAHETLYATINELITSDKYYLAGDLGVKPNGDLIDGTHDGDYSYFCNTLADVLNPKNVNCLDNGTGPDWLDTTGGRSDHAKSFADTGCRDFTGNAEIVTSDGASFYQINPKITLGISIYNQKLNSDNPEHMADIQCDGSNGVPVADCQNWVETVGKKTRAFGEYVDASGFSSMYKIFCMDIDGIGEGEAPFGYGIRGDGKILNGARAEEWLAKSIQEKE